VRRRVRKAALLIPLVAIPLVLGGCAQTFDTRTLGVPVTMAAPAGAVPEGAAFQVTTHSVFLLWGAVPLRQPSLQKALAAQLVGGKGVANLRVRVRSRWSDVLLTVLTAGIVVPRAVTFEGVITGVPAATAAPGAPGAAPSPAAPGAPSKP
jgi:hypothetical protein